MPRQINNLQARQDLIEPISLFQLMVYWYCHCMPQFGLNPCFGDQPIKEAQLGIERVKGPLLATNNRAFIAMMNIDLCACRFFQRCQIAIMIPVRMCEQDTFNLTQGVARSLEIFLNAGKSTWN